jgi:hypothetical protein
MEQMLFTICHGVILLAFAVTVVFTAITVFELRNTTATYNARLFTFGYFSLGAWIFWILQYALLAAPFTIRYPKFFLDQCGSVSSLRAAFSKVADVTSFGNLLLSCWLGRLSNNDIING